MFSIIKGKHTFPPTISVEKYASEITEIANIDVSK